MKHLIFVLFFISSGAAFAQVENVDPDDLYAECAELLGSPPLDTLLTREDELSGEEGNDYGNLNSDRLGATLLGVVCSRDQIMDYFLSAGWEFRGEDDLVGESGPPDSRYKQDYSIAFCKVRGLPWRIFLYRCEAIAGVTFFEGHITRVIAYVNY